VEILNRLRDAAYEDHVLFIGVVVREGDTYRVSPAGEEDVYGLVPASALIEEPTALDAADTEIFPGHGLKVIKIKRGTSVKASHKGTERTLNIPERGENRTVAIQSTRGNSTYCIVAGEFRCDNDQYIGLCIGGWTCGGK